MIKYSYSHLTKEYTGTIEVPENKHVPRTTSKRPPNVSKNQVAVFVNGDWIVKHDFRGQTVFSKINGSPKTIFEIGEIPENYEFECGQRIDNVFYSAEKIAELKDSPDFQDKILSQEKQKKILKLEEEVNFLIAKLDSGYPEFERETFATQLAEAKALIENPETEVRVLANIAANRNMDVLELAKKVVEKSNNYALILGKIIGKRKFLIDVIDAASSLEELKSISLKLED